MTWRNASFWAILVAATICASAVQAITVDFVTVANTGNAAYTNGSGSFGAVNYVYQIGKYEITAGQYKDFLNAVAVSDTYNLYNTSMNSGAFPCGIQRTGSPGSYAYSVAPDWANRPVTYVSWGEAARFANWLQHGQLGGAEDSTTTEDGAYYLNGATTTTALTSVTRKTGALYWVPTRNEWFKAAFYDPQKQPGVAGYWTYTTRSDDPNVPSNVVVTPDPGNSANFKSSTSGLYTLGSPYYRTEVGEFENSASAYGTYDQGGNIMEWLEDGTDTRQNIGGSFITDQGFLSRDHNINGNAAGVKNQHLGIRLARIALLGDANSDGSVNGADLNIVLSNYNLTGMGWTQGDFDSDGSVNGTDLNIVLSNYNQSIGVSSAGVAVPEPSSLLLAALGALGAFALAWRGKPSP
jgi:formylglycine-generating enzyme